MRKAIPIYLVAALLILAGCQNGTIAASGTVNLTAVVPNAGLTENPTGFLVEVYYTLSNSTTCRINITANTVQIDRWDVVEYFPATDESDLVAYNVTITPKNWGASGDFSIRADLYDVTNANLLDSDGMILTF